MKENKIYHGKKRQREEEEEQEDLDSEFGVPKDHLMDNINHYQNVAKSVEDLMKNQNQVGTTSTTTRMWLSLLRTSWKTRTR